MLRVTVDNLLPLLDPSLLVGHAADALGVLVQVAVLGTHVLGLPPPGLDGLLEAPDAGGSELDVGAGQTVPGHDGGGVLVPDGSEHGEAEWFEGELVTEGLEGEAFALGGGVEVAEFLDVEALAGGVLEEEYG